MTGRLVYSQNIAAGQNNHTINVNLDSKVKQRGTYILRVLTDGIPGKAIVLIKR